MCRARVTVGLPPGPEPWEPSCVGSLGGGGARPARSPAVALSASAWDRWAPCTPGGGHSSSDPVSAWTWPTRPLPSREAWAKPLLAQLLPGGPVALGGQAQDSRARGPTTPASATPRARHARCRLLPPGPLGVAQASALLSRQRPGPLAGPAPPCVGQARAAGRRGSRQRPRAPTLRTGAGTQPRAQAGRPARHWPPVTRLLSQTRRPAASWVSTLLVTQASAPGMARRWGQAASRGRPDRAAGGAHLRGG